MAEFCEVMKQAKRMCKALESCWECQMPRKNKEYSCPLCDVNSETGEVEKIERIVMDWAAENPEPRYPSWNEAWRQLFPDAIKGSCPCKQHFIGREYVGKSCYGEGCRECLEQPMTADIAEKLGIKPIGGSDNG
jgi:hypothetical protein